MGRQDMPSFSERNGYRPIRDVLQVESMDGYLRIALWNAMTRCFWVNAEFEVADYEFYRMTMDLLYAVWEELFKRPADERPKDVLGSLRKEFFSLEWYTVYELLEFLAERGYANEFPERCNDALRREGASYRFVGKQIVRITSEAEVAGIEEAMETTPGTVGTHLLTATKYLANQEDPDYRNSIKESISAVEAMVNTFVAKPTTLGKALDQLEERGVSIHPVLKAAFDKLYGFTSNAAGIRHALVDDEAVGEEEARFFLMACSAFVNYLRQKAAIV